MNPADVTVNVAGSGGGGTGSGTADYTFYIGNGLVNITASPDTGNGATTINVWGYGDVAGENTTFPGPAIDTVEGTTGSRRSFTLHNIDGFAVPNSRSVTSLEVSPGQTKDVIVTLPNSSGTWYPEVSYGDLRNNNTYSNGTVYTQLDFQETLSGTESPPS